MQLITQNEELVKTLSRLITTYPKSAFAVAWATSGNTIFSLLKKHVPKITQAVIGTHFYQTHPDVLDTFKNSPRVHFILQPSGVFHPKIYIFWDKKRWEALIGSANLTTGALSTNSEAMVLLSGEGTDYSHGKDEILSLIDSYWSISKEINEDDATAYREIWSTKQSDLSRLSGQYGSRAAAKPPTESSVMSMSWAQYFKEVKSDSYHGFDHRCNLLEFVHRAFLNHPTFESMELTLRKTIAGLPNGLDERWGWFGSMKGAGYYHQAINNNNPYISKALDAIPLHGTVTREQYNNYIKDFIKAFPNGRHGVSIASRLLALKRPDQFICLDSKNRRKLCTDFGIPSSKMDYDRYWEEVIERIMDTPWWRSRRPIDSQEMQVWDGRAAMLDAIFYEE
ncbi:HKD family nuclease [Azotobacter beijerinckii]|uniref:HKD family nuclease n=1 Tax=Azotobacter beijerinckii TaxID=170623 RepID=A0A1H9DBM9_9GAMM|nr:phospholipase D family protein [Azotobacter beijerinckii]SEQ10771.1 HKD family nuclease [Azotobacter beijerinckii]